MERRSSPGRHVQLTWALPGLESLGATPSRAAHLESLGVSGQLDGRCYWRLGAGTTGRRPGAVRGEPALRAGPVRRRPAWSRTEPVD